MVCTEVGRDTNPGLLKRERHCTRHGRLAGSKDSTCRMNWWEERWADASVTVGWWEWERTKAVAHARCPSGPVPLLTMSSLSSLLLICQWIYYSKRFASLGCPQPVTSCLGSQVAGVTDVCCCNSLEKLDLIRICVLLGRKMERQWKSLCGKIIIWFSG